MAVPGIDEIVKSMFDYLVDSFGVLGLGASIIVLIIIMVIQAIVAPIASEGVLASAGGVLSGAFGTVGIYAAIIGGIIGSLLGAITAFYIARWMQAQFKKRLVDQYVEEENINTQSRWDKFLNKLAKFLSRFIDEDSDEFIDIIEEKGFLIVLVGRLIPFVPFDAVSYASGFTHIKFKDFFIATTIGTVPRVIFYVVLGRELADALENNFGLFVVLFFVFVGGIYGLYKGIMHYLKKQEGIGEVDRTDVIKEEVAEEIGKDKEEIDEPTSSSINDNDTNK